MLLSSQVTKMGGRACPAALPIGFTKAATTVARSLSDAANQSPANFADVFTKNGCPIAHNSCPENSTDILTNQRLVKEKH